MRSWSLKIVPVRYGSAGVPSGPSAKIAAWAISDPPVMWATQFEVSFVTRLSST